MIDALAMWTIWFQSTHSLRSATLLQHLQFHSLSVSIHALLAECDYLEAVEAVEAVVSIHALLAECDFDNTLTIKQ